MVNHVPDSLKIGASVSPTVLHIFGITVEEWTFILSGIVSILFIIEKIPVLITRIRSFIKWIKEVKKG